ncbi:MAG TPA: amino acid permease [Bryobacteraceae bacterium]|nr:amino acid permease [Bryobacteraceae bacterium]
MSRELTRALGTLDAVAIVVGIVIGSGIFVLPNLIARDLPSPTAILSVWIVAGVLSFFGALAYAELGAMMPHTGGQYVYLREAWGPRWAFVSGWTFMLAVTTGGAAWLSVTFSIYAGHFFALGPVAQKTLSIALVAVLSVFNYIGVREGAWIQRAFTGLKILALVLLIAGAFLIGHGTPVPPAPPPAHPLTLARFSAVMAACLMAYNGWSFVSFVAGEIKDPQRNVFRALVIGMTIVGALYVFANVAYFRVMNVAEIASSERVAADFATHLIGPVGATLVSLSVLLSIVGAVNGCILTGARLPFAQARDGLFFARFSEVHPRFHTPAPAVVWGGLWTVILILTGSYETLYSYSILAAWLFYTMSAAAVFVLRRKMPDAPRPYRMWGYPWTLLLFIAVSLWFMAEELVAEPIPSAMAAVIVVAGLLAWKLWRVFAPAEKVSEKLVI